MKFVLAIVLLSLASAHGDVLLNEVFATDPIGTRATVTGEDSRFTHSPGELIAHYDLLEPHARVAWPLPQSLTETDSFTATLEFTLRDVEFDDFNLCQLSFGFINQIHTGPRRTSSPGSSWECLNIDYFPGQGFPSYTPTFIRQRPEEGGDPLNSTHLKFPDGSTSLINDFGEIGQLPQNTRLTTQIRYDAGTQNITISLADAGGGLAINAFGTNPDGDESTIQLQLAERYPFEFDAFALLLWDHFQGGRAELIAHSITVETPALDLLALAFPNGEPSPVYADGMVMLTYHRDLTIAGFAVSAEHSTDLLNWSPVGHTVLSAGPADEVRRVTVKSGFLRLRVTAQ